MSRNNPYHHHPYALPNSSTLVVVHDHDVLSGRGVNIAHHPGNERFRTLISTHGSDTSYCTAYTAVEKKAVAEEIIQHIYSLDPPGRFLKRDGRGRSCRGLQGPWQILSERDAIKKTTQALRDCNRHDREGYADGVAVPTDVELSALSRAQSGLTAKQLASQLARSKQHGRISPSVEHAAEWLQKQRTAFDYHVNEVTPSTSDEMQEDRAASSLLSMAPNEYYTHGHSYPYYSAEPDDVVEAASAIAGVSATDTVADAVYSDMSVHEAACLLAGDDGMLSETAGITDGQ